MSFKFKLLVYLNTFSAGFQKTFIVKYHRYTVLISGLLLGLRVINIVTAKNVVVKSEQLFSHLNNQLHPKHKDGKIQANSRVFKIIVTTNAT